MRVLSLFSGAGGMDRGLEAAGHDVVGLCEIDPAARKVLRRHWPDVPTWEDVTNVRACACIYLTDGSRGGLRRQPDTGTVPGANDLRLQVPNGGRTVRSVATGDLPGQPDSVLRCLNCGGVRRGRVDLVAGGSPCQDLSVAGRRAGLDGERSGLFWHQCRIAAESGARWILWENVAGALSSNDGRDFAAVLWGLTGTWPDVPEDGWRSVGVCVGAERTAVWRLLDARWFGVAQRRRRVFVVCGPRGECRPEVLVEPESCPRDSRPGAAAGAGVAVGALAGVGPNGGWRIGADEAAAGHLVAWNESGHGAHYTGGVGTLRATDHKRPEGRLVVPTVSFNRQGAVEQGADVQTEFTGSLGTTRHPAVAISENQRGEIVETDYAHQLTTGGGKPGQGYPAVAYPLAMRGRADGAELEVGDPDVYNSLRAGYKGNELLTPDLAVRRLTPRECERLMSWPDDWTRWADDGTEIADSHRYRMCGNGVVSNVTEWIGRRLMEVAA